MLYFVCLSYCFVDLMFLFFYLSGVTNESNLKFMTENGFYRDLTGSACSVTGCAGVLRFLSNSLLICFCIAIINVIV